MRKIIIAYIPVLHRGYLDFLAAENTEAIFLVSEDVVMSLGNEFDYLARKDALRAVPASEMAAAIQALSFLSSKEVKPLDMHAVRILQHREYRVVCPDEDVSRAIVKKYFPDHSVDFIPVFLRWNRDNVTEEHAVVEHRRIHISTFHNEMMRLAREEAVKSFDWWRQVGAVLVNERTPVIIAHNSHVPDEQTPYAFGDPRSIFKRGIHLELSTAEHAEAVVIAEAARRGIKTEGSSLYVSTFPCPPCAKLIARSKVTHCYFGGGYAVLDGEDNLKKAGVELVFVAKSP